MYDSIYMLELLLVILVFLLLFCIIIDRGINEVLLLLFIDIGIIILESLRLINISNIL